MHTTCTTQHIFCPPCPPRSDKAFISKGYDATTHFETTVDDVLAMYKRITGNDLDLSKEPANVVDQQ